MMNKLHPRLIQHIQNFGDTESQINVLKVSKSLNQLNLTIIMAGKPNNDILIKYAKFIHTLNADDNPKITDASVKYLVNLHTLYANGNSGITDASVKNLVNLHTLEINSNLKITDASVKNLVKL